jgi:uroporphyrinogen decarboxylase
MTHRERVRLAFQHREPDRVPIYDQTVCSRVASDVMGRRVRTGGGLIRFEETSARWESEQAWQEYAAQLLDDVGDMIRELDFDLVGIPWRCSWKPSARLDECTFRYEDPSTSWWTVYHYDVTSDVYDEVDSAVRQEGIPAIERMVQHMEREAADARPPSAESYEAVLQVARRAGGERYLRSGEGAVMIPPGAAWLEACATRADLIERYLDCHVRAALLAVPVARQVGVECLWAGGDLASSKGPLYSPAMFRRFVLPRVRQIADAAHVHGLRYLFRTDGNVWSIAEDLFVNSHIDGYGEIDIDAGMDLPEVKRRYPHLTLWGGMSCGQLLTFGTPQMVRDEVKRVMAACKPGGGLIFGSSNAVHAGVPTENFVAMQQAAREFGVYAH